MLSFRSVISIRYHIGRRLVVVWRILRPVGCQQRADGVACPAACHGLLPGLGTVGLHPADLVGISLQPRLHVVGHVVRVDGSAVGIAEDVGGAVVAADDDESSLPADVEDVVTLLGCGQLEFCLY